MMRKACDLESNAGAATSGHMTGPLTVSKAGWHQGDLREALASEENIEEYAKPSKITELIMVSKNLMQ